MANFEMNEISLTTPNHLSEVQVNFLILILI